MSVSRATRRHSSVALRAFVTVVASALLLSLAPSASADSLDRQWPVDTKGDGCSSPVWPSGGPQKDPRRVLVVGDSLIRNSRTILERKLKNEGWLPTVRCWGAKGTDWGLAQILRARSLNQLPETIVVSLGTNDVWWLHLDFAAGIDNMMDAIGSHRRVYWVNLWFGPNGYDDLPKPTAANRILREKAAQYPNLTIINFAQAFKDADAKDPAVGWEDGVHLNDAGNRVRVHAIVDAIGSPTTSDDTDPAPAPDPSPTPEPTPTPTDPGKNQRAPRP